MGTRGSLNVGQAEFNLRATLANMSRRRMKKAMPRSKCFHTCCLIMLFIFALIAAFTLGWVSRAEYDEILEAELRELAELRPPRQSPAGKGKDPAKVLKAFDKVLFPKPKIAEMSAKEREYFKGLASNKEFIQNWAEDLSQALDTTKSGTLTKEEADPLLRPICERCSLYSDQTYWARPRGTGTFWYKVI